MRVHDLTMHKSLGPADLQMLSQNANRFSSEIKIRYDQVDRSQVEIDVKSLLGMMLLPIGKGAKITLVTKGPDEKEAIDYMCDLLEKPEELQ